MSAQKALLAKVKQDAKKLLERSRILALEHALGNEIIPAQARDRARQHPAATWRTSSWPTCCLIISQRTKGVYEHMEELGGLSGKNHGRDRAT
ncbi:MAG: hypothetical protein MZV65_52885 [Chromatiales bacterium]|nr:hypothetical protein [Chromatiales bacterium]